MQNEEKRMKPEFLSKAEKKKLIEKLKENFGIENLPYLLIKLGKEKIYSYSGSLSREEIAKITREINVEKIGIYMAREEEDGIRLSFDFPFLVKGQISKNVLDINEKQVEDWLKGKNLSSEEKIAGFVVLKHKQDFFGCGKVSGGIINNFVPKERRIKD